MEAEIDTQGVLDLQDGSTIQLSTCLMLVHSSFYHLIDRQLRIFPWGGQKQWLLMSLSDGLSREPHQNKSKDRLQSLHGSGNISTQSIITSCAFHENHGKIFIHRRVGELQNIPKRFMSKSHVGLTVIETTNIRMGDNIIVLCLRS